MSDQGELAGRRGTPGDDTNHGFEPVDHPTGPFERADASGAADERIDINTDTGAMGGGPAWEPAESMSFSSERTSGPGEGPGGADFDGRLNDKGRSEPADHIPDPDDHVSGPSSSGFGSWSAGVDDTDPSGRRPYDDQPGDDRGTYDEQHDEYGRHGDRGGQDHGGRGDHGDHGGHRSGPGRAPVVWDDASDDEAREPASGPESLASEQARPGWERSLFDDGGMDAGPGDPRYAPVDMSGPATPPKPGTPSSGNLRLPDWMKESHDQQEAGPSTGPGDRDRSDDDGGGRSRTILYAGIGLLVVALLAVGGVVLLRGSGDADADSGGSGSGAGATSVPAPKQVSVSLPPERALRRFTGTPSRVAGQIRDEHAGLAYPRLSAPWVLPTKQNNLIQLGWSGQQILVTEKTGARMWYGQVVSGLMGVGDLSAYTGPGSEREAAVAVSKSLLQREYSFKHTASPYASQALDVDGRKGWLVATALRYRRPGVKATGELVAVAVIDTGRKVPAVVFMAVPNTHQKLWPDVNTVFGNLRVLP